MTRKLTNDEYLKRVKNINPNLIVLESYIAAQIKIKHQCKICDNIWHVWPDAILHGQGCPLCGIKRSADKRRKTQEQYIKDIKKIKPNILVLEVYKGAFVPILHKCNICKYEFKSAPTNMMTFNECLRCYLNSRRPTQSEYIEKVNKIHNNKILVLEEFKTTGIKIKHQCIKCNLIWDVIPESILYGRGCPRCNHTGIQPKEYKLGSKNVIVRGYEPYALDYLIYIRNICPKKIFVFTEKVVPIIKFTFRKKECRHYPDIFIPDKNLLIEVKSPYTFGFYSNTHLEGDTPDGYGLFLKNKAKCKAAKKEGFKYEVLLFKEKILIKLPKNWYNMKYEQVKEFCGFL
jgi:preprotein translocase subunit Sss1